jgi:hypothetical protein
VVFLSKAAAGFMGTVRFNDDKHRKNREKQARWQARHRKPKKVLYQKGSYCVFRYGEHVFCLPLYRLSNWAARIEAAQVFPKADLQVILGGMVQLTWQAAAAIRAMIGGPRRYGPIKVGRNGATVYRSETEAARGEGVDRRAIHLWRDHGCHGQDFWL